LDTCGLGLGDEARPDMTAATVSLPVRERPIRTTRVKGVNGHRAGFALWETQPANRHHVAVATDHHPIDARAVNEADDVVWLRVEIVGHHLWHAFITKIRPVERFRVVRGEKTAATSTAAKVRDRHVWHVGQSARAHFFCPIILMVSWVGVLHLWAA